MNDESRSHSCNRDLKVIEEVIEGRQGLGWSNLGPVGSWIAAPMIPYYWGTYVAERMSPLI